MVALDRALAEADALRERAKIHALRGELGLAHHDLDALVELRGFVPNSIHDAEDLRVVAVVRAAEGDLAAAERALREVIRRAEVHRLSQLHAEATRDLGALFAREQVPIDSAQGRNDPVAPHCISESRAYLLTEQLDPRAGSHARAGMLRASLAAV